MCVCTFSLIALMYVDHQNRPEQVNQIDGVTGSLQSVGISVYGWLIACYMYACVCILCDISTGVFACVCVCVRAILVRRIPHVSAEWRFVWAQLRLCACILLYSFQQNIFILNPLLCGIYGWIPIFSIELCEWIWFQTTFLIRKVSGLLLPPKWMMIFSQSDVCDKLNVTLFRVRMKEMRSHSSMISNVYICTRTHTRSEKDVHTNSLNAVNAWRNAYQR